MVVAQGRDWTIRSLSDPKYVVQVPGVDEAHAELVLRDLIDNAWVPSDLVLERKKRRRGWSLRKGLV